MSPRWVIAWIALVSCVVSAPAAACSIIASSEYKPYKYDERIYVFYGEVVGYTWLRPRYCAEQTTGNDECPESWGLLLKVLHPLQVPGGAKTIGVFGFGMDSLCARETIAEGEVRGTPIGTRFAVASYEVKDVVQRENNEVPAVEGHSSMLLQIPADRPVGDLADSRYDYEPMCGGIGPERRAPDFEFQKDLVRLHHTKSEQDALEILLRLASCEQDELLIDDLTHLYLRRADSIRQFKRKTLWRRYLDSGDEALELQLAKSGNVFAQIEHGVRLNERNESEEALAWFRRITGRGALPAQLYMALLYKKLEDRQRAEQTFADVLRKARRGADRGDNLARVVLAEMLYDGIGDTELAPETARKLWCVATKAHPTQPPYPLVSNIGRETENDRSRCEKYGG